MSDCSISKSVTEWILHVRACATVSSDQCHLDKCLLFLFTVQDNTVHYLQSPLCCITHDGAFKALWHCKWHFDKVVPSAEAGLKIQSVLYSCSGGEGWERERKGNADEQSVVSDVHISGLLKSSLTLGFKVSRLTNYFKNHILFTFNGISLCR